MTIDNGGPAFASAGLDWHQDGMSLRDYFAAQALPAIIAAYVEANGRCIGSDHVRPNCASHAYKFADAMLAERTKSRHTED